MSIVTRALAADGPNAQQIEYWNRTSGPKWVAHEAFLDAQIGELGRVAMERADLAPGERALDVGCGCGATSLELAARVGPSGSVLGVDISVAMLGRARERARSAGLANVEFANADAQTHAFAPGERDVVFSRFGVMFFADPPAAFANLRRALRPGGRLAFVCWRPLAVNPWMRVPLELLARVVELPAPAAPGAPGPFAFADPERVRGILESAGFASLELAPLDRELALAGGGSLEQVVSFLLGVGPVSAALAEASAEQRERAAEVLREGLRAHADARGVVLGAACWIATARNPHGFGEK